jgi:hypothetical protein
MDWGGLWASPPTAPPYYAHPEDGPYVDAFNRVRGEHAGGKYRLRTDLLPEPVLGPHDARLVILNKNPTLDEADPELHHQDGPYREALLTNLRSSLGQFPHVLPRRPFGTSHSGAWWRPRLRQLIEAAGGGDQLASRLLAVEFHGYHAAGYHAIPVTLPSQLAAFGLVREALDRGALILVMRGRELWEVAIPELGDHPNVLHGKNPQSVYVTPDNVDGDFERVLAAVR